MEPANTTPPRDGPSRQSIVRRLGRARTPLLVALLVVVVAAGVGGVVFASGLSRPSGGILPAQSAANLPIVTVYDPRASHGPKGAPPTGTPQPCNCTVQKQVRQNPPTPVPAPGQYIVVSLSKQWLWAYEGGKAVFNTPVTTGHPGLDTPTGYFTIQEKDWGVTFISPWPKGNPNYYDPEYIDFAMLFAAGGYFIHDAPWRHCFGPGTNVPHTCPDGTQETGSHGCVNVPYSAGNWLINWVRIGTTVEIDA